MTRRVARPQSPSVRQTPLTQRPGVWVNGILLVLAAVVFVALLALGTWQVQRRAWKLDLIEQVEARAYGAPTPAPQGAAPEYLRVQIKGRYLHDKTLKIKAVTDLGLGFWLMTPLQTQAQTYWVNRGFVPSSLSSQEWSRPSGPQTVTGLVRASVPGGTWLERNDPAQNRWYSADVSAMSATAQLPNVAPYPIDAEASSTDGDWPRAGMTKLVFRNTHLTYAATWYTMAALFAAGLFYVIRSRNAP